MATTRNCPTVQRPQLTEHRSDGRIVTTFWPYHASAFSVSACPRQPAHEHGRVGSCWRGAPAHAAEIGGAGCALIHTSGSRLATLCREATQQRHMVMGVGCATSASGLEPGQRDLLAAAVPRARQRRAAITPASHWHGDLSATPVGAAGSAAVASGWRSNGRHHPSQRQQQTPAASLSDAERPRRRRRGGSAGGRAAPHVRNGCAAASETVPRKS